MKNNLSILVADDDAGHRQMLRTVLQEWGYNVMEAKDGEEAARVCLDKNSAPPALALLDVRMPRKSGLEALTEIRRGNPDLPVVIMTAYSEIPDAVETIRNGAWDYLTKPLDFDKLKTTLGNIFTQLGHSRENAGVTASLENSAAPREIIGASPAMAELSNMIRAVAPTEATVLISGESGTGKELAARAVHEASKHANGPFVAVNCGALTESLLASELFGHEKGAFTGADRKHDGLFVEAGNGSIFLDEIGEMPPGMQVKLLRVLQEKEVLGVGCKKPAPIHCRVIAATNRDLARDVEEGKFRGDLYYRLNVVTLNMPPLRERADDVPVLALHFARKFAKIYSRDFDGFSPEALDLLISYSWPGNVRELENVIERAIILMPSRTVDARELPERLRNEHGQAEKFFIPPRQTRENDATCAPGEDGQKNLNKSFTAGLGEIGPTLEEVERAVILHTLKKLGNNKTETAKALGITRKTLHARLNRYRGKTENG